MKHLLSLLSVLCLLCAAVVFAEDIAYLDKDGNRQICSSAVEVSAEVAAWSGSPGWYVAPAGTVNIRSRVDVSGDVHLILSEGAMLNTSMGIHVAEGSSLTIYEQPATA